MFNEKIYLISRNNFERMEEIKDSICAFLVTLGRKCRRVWGRRKERFRNKMILHTLAIGNFKKREYVPFPSFFLKTTSTMTT